MNHPRRDAVKEKLTSFQAAIDEHRVGEDVGGGAAVLLFAAVHSWTNYPILYNQKAGFYSGSPEGQSVCYWWCAK